MDNNISTYYDGKYNRYVGARYVPKFANPSEWNNANTYEPLTIVLYQGNSYTSKTFVPAGVEITNETYWAETGNYNAQIEAYRQEVQEISEQINTLENDTNENFANLEKHIATFNFQPNDEAREQYENNIIACAASYLVRNTSSPSIVGNPYRDSGKPFVVKYDGTKQYTSIYSPKNDFVYTDTEPVGSETCNVMYLNCVGFTSLLTKNRRYEVSPYNYAFNNSPVEDNTLWDLAQNNYSPKTNPLKYAVEIDFLNNASIFRQTLVASGSCGALRYLSKHPSGGDLTIATDEINNMRTGDIVYLARSTAATNNNYYLGINHCCVYIKDKTDIINFAAQNYNTTLQVELTENDNETYGYIVDVVSGDIGNVMRFKTLYSIMQSPMLSDSFVNVLYCPAYPTTANSNEFYKAATLTNRMGQYTEILDLSFNRTALIDHYFGKIDLPSVGCYGSYLNNFNVTDLNNADMAGVFYITPREASKFDNMPNNDGYAGLLICMGFQDSRGTAGLQMYCSFRQSNLYWYVRNRGVTNVWSEWSQLQFVAQP